LPFADNARHFAFIFGAAMVDLQIVIQTEDNRIFYDMPEHSPCTDCGACCRHFRVSFYQGELDTFPGGFVPTELTSDITPFLVCMQGTEQGGGRCIALQPDNRCAIYSMRPSPCREFPVYLEDGSLNPQCLRLRSMQGIELPVKAA
jgi:Fe-S-cluster containining protein